MCHTCVIFENHSPKFFLNQTTKREWKTKTDIEGVLGPGGGGGIRYV
jgi:hypothetical protein